MDTVYFYTEHSRNNSVTAFFVLKNIQNSHTKSKVSTLYSRSHIFASMNGFTKILLVAGAGAAIWYLPTLLALYNMTCSIVAVYPTNMTGSRIDAIATMKLTNNSGTRVDITSLVADILFNGVKIAQLNQTENLPILGNSEQNFNVAFTIDAEIVGTNIIAQLMAQNLQNFVLEVKGTIIANNKKLPFDTFWTIKDFIQK